MPTQKNPRIGQELRGFRLIERIGVGGFAEVYRAEQISLKRFVAVKTLHADQRNIPEFEDRFEAEAQIVARLDHPYIVPIIDYWYAEHDGAYIVMRWINGNTLAEKIDKQAITVAALLRYLDNITQALDYAHRLGIIHRDIKPSNILLDTEDSAYLADFGIAQDIQKLRSADQSSMIGGTLGFIAPELAFGQTLPQPHSDLYSLAIVVYMCLTGRHPFSPGELRHLTEPMPDLPANIANAAVSKVIKKAGSHTVDERYENARDFYEAFKSAIRDGEQLSVGLPKTVNLAEQLPSTTKRVVVPVIGARSALLIDHPDDVPERAEKFIARETHLAQMQEAIANKRHILLHGTGGIGKTTLAAEFASQLLADESNDAVLWLRVGENTYLETLAALMKPLAVDLSKIEEHAHRKTIREALEKHAIKYVILDDVWMDGRDLKRVINIFPRDVCCICTSRSRYPIGHVFDVNILSEADSVALLNYHAAQEEPSEADTDGAEAAKNLCRILGYHPLALEIAGKILLVDQISPQALQERLGEKIHTLTISQNYGEEQHISLQRVLETSYQRLTAACQQVFLAFGVLGMPSATPEFLAACIQRDIDTVSDNLLTLQNSSLVKSEKTGEVLSYRVHEFAHSFARQRHRFPVLAVLRGVQTYIQEMVNRVDILEADYINILMQADVALQQKQDSICLNIVNHLVVKSQYALTRGYDNHLLKLLDNAIEFAQESTPQENETLHYLLGKRGDVARDSKQYDKALADYQQSLALAKILPLPERQVVVMCVMSQIYANRKEFDMAAQILRDAEAQANQLGTDNVKTRVLENRGYLAQAMGDIQTASEIFMAQLELALKTDDERRKFFAYLNYGAANVFLKEFDRASINLNHALDIARQQSNRIWEGYAHHAIGTMYHENKNREKAQESLHQALACFEQSAVQAKIEEVRLFIQANEYPLPVSE